MAAPLVAVAAVAAVVWEALTVHQIRLARHCGFDGASWCAMANGGRGDEPFQRRFLLPLIVRVLHYGDVVARFAAVNLVACAAIAVLTGLLARRFARLLDVPAERAVAGSVIAGALTGFAVFPWRFTFMIPVNTDVAGAALVLAWLVVMTADTTRVARLSPLVAAAAVTTRDMNALPLVVTMLTLAVVSRGPRRRLALVNVVVLAVAAAGTFLVPAARGSSYSTIAELQVTLHNLGTGHGSATYLWMTVSGLGLVPALAVPTLRARNWSAFAPAWALMISGVATAIGVFGSTDRYLLPEMTVGVALAVACVASRPRLDAALMVLAGASVALWRPWLSVSGDVRQILRVYDAYLQPWSVDWPHLLLDLRDVATGGDAVVLVLLGGYLWTRRQALRASLPPLTLPDLRVGR